MSSGFAADGACPARVAIEAVRAGRYLHGICGDEPDDVRMMGRVDVYSR